MDSDFTVFANWFYDKTGLDLNQYNQTQVMRRLGVVMGKYGYRTHTQLVGAIQKNPLLLKECLDKLTINVSGFFRDSPHWDKLRAKIPQLAVNRKQLRIWCVGCAAGQEVYSLLYLLSQLLAPRRYQVRASDVDNEALAAAREGIYPQKALAGLSHTQRNVMFRRVDINYQVRDRFRSQVMFFRHDILRDAIGLNNDLILCRNVMIYFRDETKAKVIRRLADALIPGGLLFVGASEQIMNASCFQLKNEDVYFYRKELPGS